MLQFQAPKSFKSGRLIMGIYTAKDLTLLIASILISLILTIGNLVIAQGATHLYLIGSTVLFILPTAIIFAGLQPCSIYHNNFGMLKEFLSFRKRQKHLSWEGIYKHDEEFKEN